MEKNHKLVPCGKKAMNFQNRHSDDTFIDRHGNTVKIPTIQASGIQFRTLELDHENEGVVFRIGDVVLNDAVALDWDNWQPHDRGVAPNGKLIDDTFASRILDEAIRMNPEQATELNGYKNQINS